MPAVESFLRTAEGRVLGSCGTRVDILFLEGAFRLYSGDPPLDDHLSHTDFHRGGGILAPGSWAATAASPASLLERCVIYDGGARGFSPRTHLMSLHRYWERLCAAIITKPDLMLRHLAVKAGVPLRLPSWRQWRSSIGHAVPEAELSQEYEALRGVWHGARDGRIVAECVAQVRSVSEAILAMVGEVHDQDNR